MANPPKAKSETTADEAAAQPLRIPLHDPVHTLFADGCHGANVIAGCVRLDLFAEHAWSGSKGNQQMVVGRVVVPLDRFQMFVRGLNVVAKKLQDEQARVASSKSQPAKGDA